MKLLVYGAGVIGSLLAAKLKTVGNDVTVLARGGRLEEIRSQGIVLEDAVDGKRSVTKVNVIEVLGPDDNYELILVTIPKHQVASIMPALSANTNSSMIMFMLNSALGFDEWAQAIGRERMLLGFPGAGGKREDGVVRYRLAPKRMQPNTMGEIDGSTTDRLKKIAGLFQEAGLAAQLSSNMDAWLRYHVAWTSPFMNALHMAGGDARTLCGRPDIMRLEIRAVRESFSVLRALGFPVTPSSLKMRWETFPESVLIVIFRQILKTKLMEDLVGGHASVALPEFKLLSEEFQVLARSTDIPTPATDELHSQLERSEVKS